ncbi:MAG: outer membrane protein assembly factor BamC [Gallionella sp.]
MNVLQTGVSVVALLSIVGCSSLQSDKLVDYRAGTVQAPRLELPPDLTAPEVDELYKVPQGEGTATYSEYSKTGDSSVKGGSRVLPAVPGVRLERDGARRWLVINEQPDKVWPIARTFWQEQGLIVGSEQLAAGVMETEWAENRAKKSKSTMRNALGKLFETMTLTGQKDQYVTRLERGKDGKTTEVYISHRGMEEAGTDEHDKPLWRARAGDPELEAIMLQMMMVQFGASESQAKSALASGGDVKATAPTVDTAEPVGSASLRAIDGGNVVIAVSDRFDRAWRRAGLAIEGAGLAVEDKDREKGIYYLQPLKIQSGWLDKLKFWKQSDRPDMGYRVYVKDGGASCDISVLDPHGENSKVTKQITEELFKNINQ